MNKLAKRLMFYLTSIYSLSLQNFYKLQHENTNIHDMPKCWLHGLRLNLLRIMFINYKLMFGHNILYPRGTKQDYTLYVWPFLLHTENGLRIPLKGKHKRGFKMSPLRISVPQSFATLFFSFYYIIV